VSDIDWRDQNVEPEIEWLEYKKHPNYYETLEVSPNASIDVIKKVYRVLVEKYHPDKHPENRRQWAEEMTKSVNEAFAVLGDEQKRKRYDDQRASQHSV
jgi:DnaJ-class molecular chaperone